MDTENLAEPKTIGLTQGTKAKLERLKSDGYFKEMQDAYKFAVGLALASGGIANPLKNTTTVYGTGDLDQDRSLYEAVKALRDNMTSENEAVYKTVERLAEWGINELSAMAESGNIDFSSLMTKVSKT